MALATEWPIDVIGIPKNASDANNDAAEGFCDASLPVRTCSMVGRPESSIGQPGLVGFGARAAHYAAGTLPFMSEPRQFDEFRETLPHSLPALVIVHSAELAHLSLMLPAEVPVIAALEEGSERHAERATGARSVKERLVMSSELGRIRRLYRQVAERSAKVLVISEFERDYFANIVDESKLIVVPHGIDCDFFSPPQLPESHGDVDVLVVGDLTQSRNWEPVLSVCRAAVDSGLDEREGMNWAFVGPVAEHFVQQLPVRRSVVTGYVADVRPYYARAKVALVAATRPVGVKTTILQAWAMGTAVVASEAALTGLPADIDHNLVVGRSPEEVATQLSRVLGDGILRESLSVAGRQTVLRRRDIKSVAEQVLQICVETVSGD